MEAKNQTHLPLPTVEDRILIPFQGRTDLSKKTCREIRNTDSITCSLPSLRCKSMHSDYLFWLLHRTQGVQKACADNLEY
jgi:hypothetical protein